MVLLVLALGIGIGTLISYRVNATGPADSQLQMQTDGKPVAGGAFLGLPARVMMPLGLAVGCLSVVGDLTESLLKRSAGVKDSGQMLPGHGGILDRIDGVVAGLPLYALALVWLGRVPG
jgi:CDP-diglyceride synthetase